MTILSISYFNISRHIVSHSSPGPKFVNHKGMATTIIISITIGVIFLLIKGIRQAREPIGSKPSIMEHPSTFDKQSIEMVEKKTNADKGKK